MNHFLHDVTCSINVSLRAFVLMFLTKYRRKCLDRNPVHPLEKYDDVDIYGNCKFRRNGVGLLYLNFWKGVFQGVPGHMMF